MVHSIIIPTHNEGANQLFPLILENLAASKLPVIAVDGGSCDDTLDKLNAYSFKLLHAPSSNRAERFNVGLRGLAEGMVLLHHPRTLLSPEALAAFAKLDQPCWGGFTHSFDKQHPVLAFTSFSSNHVRLKRGIVYLDHCIFAPRPWLRAVGDVPELDIFEDTALSAALRKIARPRRIPIKACTSAIRFDHNGIYQQSAMNQMLKLAYYLNWSKSKMNGIYEASLHLNKSKTKKDTHA